MENGLRTPAGSPVECRHGVQYSGIITDGARYRALLGWGRLVACYVSAFRGVS